MTSPDRFSIEIDEDDKEMMEWLITTVARIFIRDDSARVRIRLNGSPCAISLVEGRPVLCRMKQ
jgi:hypothetical protein